MKIEIEDLTVSEETGFCNVTVNLKGETYSDSFFADAKELSENKGLLKTVVDHILQQNNIFSHMYLWVESKKQKAVFERMDNGKWKYSNQESESIFEPIANTIYTRQIV